MLLVEIYKDRSGEFRSRIKARNGNILFDSGEGYKRRAGAMRALNRIMTTPANEFRIKDVDA